MGDLPGGPRRRDRCLRRFQRAFPDIGGSPLKAPKAAERQPARAGQGPGCSPPAARNQRRAGRLEQARSLAPRPQPHGASRAPGGFRLNSDEMLPVAKKTTVGNLLENIDYSKHGGMKEGIHPHQGANSTIYICPGSALLEEEHESREQEIASDQIDQDLYDQCTQVTHETLQPSSKSGFDCSDYLNLME